MGIDCSNCKCTNKEDENILYIDNSEKMFNSQKIEIKKEKIEFVKNKVEINMNIILNKVNTSTVLLKSIVKIQCLFKQCKPRKNYKALLKKLKVNQNYFSQEEYYETINKKTPFDMTKPLEEKTYTYKSSAVYKGTFLGGFRHGKGIMKWPDGTYYEGEWNLGYAEGPGGNLSYPSGDYMKGEFRYNKLNGYGECFNTDLGYEYKGYWENDLQTGQGSEWWPDGSEYFGLYEFGKKDGFGKYSWPDESYYLGEWKDNKICGLGLYYWNDGRKYIGEWKSSKMNGFGAFMWKDGRSYRGEYKDDKKHWFGIYNGNEGKVYEGFWENGFQKGLGKYTKKDSYKVGYWEDSQITMHITDETEISAKIREINSLVDETNLKVQHVLTNLKQVFTNYIPNTDIDALIEGDNQD